MRVYFDGSNYIATASITNYLLEKSRCVAQCPSERNYHVFYQMCAGMPPSDLRSSLMLQVRVRACVCGCELM